MAIMNDPSLRPQSTRKPLRGKPLTGKPSSNKGQHGKVNTSQKFLSTRGALLWLIGSGLAASLAFTLQTNPSFLSWSSLWASPSPEAQSLSQTPASFDEAIANGEIPSALSRQSRLSTRPQAEQTAFRTAARHYLSRKIDAGDASAQEVKDHALRVILEWLAVRLGQAPFNRVMAFLQQNPDWPTNESLRKRAEEALLSEKLSPATMRLFFAARRPQTATGKIALALAFQQDRAASDAALLIRDAWRNDVFSKEREEKVLETFSEILTASDHRARMEHFLFREEWDNALRSATRAGKDFDTLVQARRAVVAKAKNAQALLDAVPLTQRVDSSYAYSRALFYRYQENWIQAGRAITETSRDPRLLVAGDDWWDFRRLIARQLLDRNEPQLAYDVVRQHGAQSPAMQIEAEFHAGWIALRFLNEPQRALRHFTLAANIAETPISIARMAYWQGRASESMGQDQEAKRFYAIASGHRVTYYGQLARARLGRVDLTLRPVPVIDARTLNRLQNMPAVEAIRVLKEMDEHGLALALYRELAQTLSTAAEVAAVGDIARQNRHAKASLVLGKTAVGRGFPMDIHAFPTFGVPVIDLPYAGVDRALVHAIARQESEFDPEAMSHAGARGLMQMMPATARETARRISKPFEVTKLIDDPIYNATLGAAHLSDLLKDWNGSYILTFAAYNAGSGNVRKWITAYGDPRDPSVDPVDWVERIPFSETRNYVQRVMENMQVYRQRFGERTALMTEADLRSGIALKP
jgi:soluble lytic murein transglycosylase